jgi:hypothetical protein
MAAIAAPQKFINSDSCPRWWDKRWRLFLRLFLSAFLDGKWH